MNGHQLTQIANEIHNSRDLSGTTKQFLLNELSAPVSLIDFIDHRPQQQSESPRRRTMFQQHSHPYPQPSGNGNFSKPRGLSEKEKAKWVADKKADVYNHVGAKIHHHTTFWLGNKECPSIDVSQRDMEVLTMQAAYLAIDNCQNCYPTGIIGFNTRDPLVDAVNTCVNIYWARALMRYNLTGVPEHRLQEIQKWLAEGDRLNGFLSYVEQKVAKPNNVNTEPSHQHSQPYPQPQDIFETPDINPLEERLVKETENEVLEACQRVLRKHTPNNDTYWKRVFSYLDDNRVSLTLVDHVARYAIHIFQGTVEQYTGTERSDAIERAAETILNMLWTFAISEEEKHTIPDGKQNFVGNPISISNWYYFTELSRQFDLKHPETLSSMGRLTFDELNLNDCNHPKLFNGIKPKGTTGCIPLPEVNNGDRDKAKNLVLDLLGWDGDTVVQGKMNMIDKICTYILIAAPGLTLEELAQIDPEDASKYLGIGDVSVRMLDTIRQRAQYQKHLESGTKPKSMGGAG